MYIAPEDFNSYILSKIRFLRKAYLLQILNETNKKLKIDELSARVIELLDSGNNEFLINKIYTENIEGCSLSGYDVERILDITSRERLKWTKTDFLKADFYNEISKYGKTLSVPCYNAKHIYDISQDDIQTLRTKEKKDTLERKKTGVIKAKETKIKNEKQRIKIKDEIKDKMKEWARSSIEASYVYKLAYWTVWISRWAKQYQLKSIKTNKAALEYKYKNKKEDLYTLKNNAMDLLYKSNYCKAYAYVPDEPDKQKLRLCDLHYNIWASERKEFEFWYDKWDYFSDHADEIKHCPNCDYELFKNYYSLYSIEISNPDIDDISFSFHVPYPAAPASFPSIKKLKRITQEENGDGIFRFGRNLFPDEEVLYTEKSVLKNFNEAFSNLLHILAIVKET